MRFNATRRHQQGRVVRDSATGATRVSGVAFHVDDPDHATGEGLLRNACWFDGFDWAALATGELMPPPLFELPLFAPGVGDHSAAAPRELGPQPSLG